MYIISKEALSLVSLSPLHLCYDKMKIKKGNDSKNYEKELWFLDTSVQWDLSTDEL